MHLVVLHAVEELRNAAGRTQEDVARRAGISVRTYWSAENMQPVTLAVAERIAAALCVPLARLHPVPWEDRDDDAFGRRPAGVTYKRQLDQASRADMQGDHEQAVGILMQLVEFAEDALTVFAAHVDLGTYLSSAGLHEEALARLDRVLADAELCAQVPRHLVRWARYHRGISLRRLGRLSEARDIFKALVRLKFFRPSALHQLAVITFLEAQDGRNSFESAETEYLACLLDWQRSRAPATYRIGYTLQRLGDLYATTDRPDVALECYLDALEVFVRYGCTRYREATRAALARLFHDHDAR